MNIKIEKKIRRAKRVRAKLAGTAASPRLTVFRSNKYIYAQLIDDVARKTVISGSTAKIKTGAKAKQAEHLGELLGKNAAGAGIKRVVFDRGSYKFHGRVKAVAEGIKKSGIKI